MKRIRIMLSAILGEKRIKQSELARATGISTATINRYYNETVDRLSLQVIEMMCEALHCTLKDMLVEEIVSDGPTAIEDYAWEKQTRPRRRGQ